MLDVLCGTYKKTILSRLSPDYIWPGMTNVCYFHKLNDILNM